MNKESKVIWNGLSIEILHGNAMLNWDNLSLNLGKSDGDLWRVLPLEHVIGEGYAMGDWNTQPLDEIVKFLKWSGNTEEQAILLTEEWFYDLCRNFVKSK